MKGQILRGNIFRVIALMLCVVMCFALCACDNSSTTTSEIIIGDDDEYEGVGDVTINVDQDGSSRDGDKAGTDGKSSGSTGKVNQATEAWIKTIPSKLQGTTVTFAAWGDENAKEYAKVVKLFTKKTKINVKWVTYNEEKYVSTIVEQNAAGKGPDIVINNVTFPSSIEAVQELPSIFNVNDGFWDPRVTEALSYKGKKYFVNSYNSPFLGGGVFCFYNKQIFANNNITSPQDYVNQSNWTWANFEKCLREAHAKGFDGGSVQPASLWPNVGTGIIEYNPSTGTYISALDNASKRSDIVASLKFVAQLRKENIVSNNPLNRFASGNMAIALAGNYGMKYNGWFKGMTPSSLGVVEMPKDFNGKTANYYGGDQRAYGIGKDAKNIEGAYYLLRFFLDIDNYEEANANIFLNKNIEKFFKETYVPNYKKRSLVLEYKTVPLSLAGYPWTRAAEGTWKELFNSETVPETIETELMARKNIIDSAVKKANEKLASAVK